MTTVSLTGPIKSALLEIQNLTILVGRTFSAFVRPPLYWRDTWVQMDLLGVQSLLIVGLTGIFTGMVLALQSAVQLADFGATLFV
ncbi:MAG: ABC transporter permease, partial [Candidatus Rokuibacteriota bacterium]